MTDGDPCFLSVAEAASLIAAKRISPVELTRAYLDRIERLNGTLRAHVRVLHDEALAGSIRGFQPVTQSCPPARPQRTAKMGEHPSFAGTRPDDKVAPMPAIRRTGTKP